MAETTEQYRNRINQLKTGIENEPYIKKMREDIAEGISKTGNRQADIEDQFQEVIDNTTGKDVIAAPELIAARNGEANLKARLDKEKQEVTAQFAQTENTKADVAYVDQQISRMSGGAIKGTYTTLNALKLAYPTGTVGPFLVEEDENRYIWDINKSNWVSIGPYDPAEIEPQSITTEKYAKGSITASKISGNRIVNEIDFQSSNAPIYDQEMTANRIYIKKYPIYVAGRVSVEFKSRSVKSGKIILLKKNNNNVVVLDMIDYTSKIGMNYVETNMITEGSGNEFVAIYNLGLAYLNDTDVVGHYNSQDVIDINIGDEIPVLDRTTDGKVAMAFNVILSDIGLVERIKHIEKNVIFSNLKNPESIFSAYLQNGGDGVILGDSNTAGQGTTGYATNGTAIGNSGVLSSPNSHNWANRLVDVVETINPGCNMRNWGISGWNTSSFLSKGLSNFIKTSDKIAIIMLGTNDRTKIDSRTEDMIAFENRLQQIIDHCNYLSIPYIIMSCIPATIGNDNDTVVYSFDTFDVNNIIKKVANRNGTTHIDNYDWFLRYKEENGSDDVLYSDHLHMTDFGSYDYLFRNIIDNLGITYRREEINR